MEKLEIEIEHQKAVKCEKQTQIHMIIRSPLNFTICCVWFVSNVSLFLPENKGGGKTSAQKVNIYSRNITTKNKGF